MSSEEEESGTESEEVDSGSEDSGSDQNDSGSGSGDSDTEHEDIKKKPAAAAATSGKGKAKPKPESEDEESDSEEGDSDEGDEDEDEDESDDSDHKRKSKKQPAAAADKKKIASTAASGKSKGKNKPQSDSEEEDDDDDEDEDETEDSSSNEDDSDDGDSSDSGKKDGKKKDGKKKGGDGGKSAPANPEDHSGNLECSTTGLFGSKKVMFCKVDKSKQQLCMFKAREAKSPGNAIPLDGAKFWTVTHTGSPGSFMLCPASTKEDKSGFLMGAGDDEERDKWYVALEAGGATKIEIIRQGILHKNSGGQIMKLKPTKGKGWAPKHVILLPDRIQFFKKNNDPFFEGQIHLPTAAFKEWPIKSAGKAGVDHMFSVAATEDEGSKVFFFAADDADSLKEWKTSFQKSFEQLDEADHQPKVQGSFKEGYVFLCIKSGLGKWDKRYAVLTGKQISFYRRRTDSTPDLEMLLPGGVQVQEMSMKEAKNRHYVFHIAESGDADSAKIWVTASNDNELMDWILKINDIVLAQPSIKAASSFREGYMEKTATDSFKTRTQRRYFVLLEDRVLYFRKLRQQQPTGRVMLEEGIPMAFSEDAPAGGTPLGWSLTPPSGKRTYCMRCFTEEERRSWVYFASMVIAGKGDEAQAARQAFRMPLEELLVDPIGHAVWKSFVKAQPDDVLDQAALNQALFYAAAARYKHFAKGRVFTPNQLAFHAKQVYAQFVAEGAPHLVDSEAVTEIRGHFEEQDAKEEGFDTTGDEFDAITATLNDSFEQLYESLVTSAHWEVVSHAHFAPPEDFTLEAAAEMVNKRAAAATAAAGAQAAAGNKSGGKSSGGGGSSSSSSKAVSDDDDGEDDDDDDVETNDEADTEEEDSEPEQKKPSKKAGDKKSAADKDDRKKNKKKKGKAAVEEAEPEDYDSQSDADEDAPQQKSSKRKSGRKGSEAISQKQEEQAEEPEDKPKKKKKDKKQKDEKKKEKKSRKSQKDVAEDPDSGVDHEVEPEEEPQPVQTADESEEVSAEVANESAEPELVKPDVAEEDGKKDKKKKDKKEKKEKKAKKEKKQAVAEESSADSGAAADDEEQVWLKKKNKEKKWVYENVRTGESMFDKPSTGKIWAIKITDQGKKYYVNNRTKESTWVKPAELPEE